MDAAELLDRGLSLRDELFDAEHPVDLVRCHLLSPLTERGFVGVGLRGANFRGPVLGSKRQLVVAEIEKKLFSVCIQGIKHPTRHGAG